MNTNYHSSLSFVRSRSSCSFVLSFSPRSLVLSLSQWSQSYGFDGFVIQRFLPSAGIETTLKNAQLIADVAYAEQYGRTLWVEYDFSGVSDATPMAPIYADVASMIATGAFASTAYQLHKGKPLIGVYGAG